MQFRWDGQIEKGATARYRHQESAIGKIGKNDGLVVGDAIFNNKKVERYQDGVWRDIGEFPFVKSWICCYSMVNFKGKLYLFGQLEFQYFRI